METYDVIVVGGGPSGMMAAGRAAELRKGTGNKVLLLEKNRELGEKLSITGGGRCNITNAEYDQHAFLQNYGEAKQFLYSPLSQFGVKDTFTFFESLKLPIVVESRKRAFPETQSAPDVTKAMKAYIHKHGVVVETGVRVQGVAITDGVVELKTNRGKYAGKKVVLASGGLSHRETGATDDGFSFLESLGHTIHAPNPDIVPLTVSDEWVKAISGVSLSFMKISFIQNGKRQFSKTGKILFTHFGLSSPLILNSAHKVRELLDTGSVTAEIDMYPDTELGSLDKQVINIFNKNKNKDFKNILSEVAPKGVGTALLMLLPKEMSIKKVHSVTVEERKELVHLTKAMPVTITGLMGYDWAVIADGGVDLKEIDTRTMQSKLHEQIYVTGDLLHISRPSGGFSLQLCWTTGYVAGSNV